MPQRLPALGWQFIKDEKVYAVADVFEPEIYKV